MKISFFSPMNNPYSAYGLRVIHESLKKHDISSNVYYYPSDFREPYTKDVLKLITEQLYGSDIIGISLYTNHFSNIVLLTEYLKKTGSKALIVWGGIHAMIRPEECIKYADIVCVGEAEECFPDLCRRISVGQPYTSVKGFWFKEKTGHIIKNEPCIIKNLNTVPFALYSDNHFLIKKNKLIPLSETNIKTFTTLASRGCPFSCAYCINSFFNRTKPQGVRHRSIDNVIEEFKKIKTEHETVKSFQIDDDAFFTLNIEYIKDFAEKYKKEIGLPLYISGITPTTINREKLKLLVDAGLDSIRIGFQSGSERILKMYHRRYTKDQMVKALEIATSFKISVQLDIITDNPWETEEDTLQTIELLEHCKKPFYLNIFNLVFFPGTELYQKAKTEGCIHDEIKEIYNTRYHTLKETPLNNTLKLLSIRANYYLNLPFLVRWMLDNKKYNSWLYSIILKFYIITNKINIPYYLMRKKVLH